MSAHEIVLLPGDGIGPEVVIEAKRTLQAVAERFSHRFNFTEFPFGGRAIDDFGVPLPTVTLEACRKADAVLMGAVGGPRWDSVAPDKRPERGLLDLRQALKVFANLRPVRLPPHLAAASPLKDSIVGEGVDLVVVRELTGGAYYGPRRRSDGGRRAEDVTVYSVAEIRRVAMVAFRLAAERRGHLASVDKANVLETSRLWRETVNEVAKSFPSVTVEHLYVDNCAMQLVASPRRFDVLLAENLFGDILSDLGGVLAGSLGMLPSASLGEGKAGLYEPVHGSAPDLAGRGLANPVGTILSAAMLLRYSYGLPREATAVEEAVDRVLQKGFGTPDLRGRGGREIGTRQMGELVAGEIRDWRGEDAEGRNAECQDQRG